MKKIISIALLLTLLVVFVSCNDTPVTPDPTPSDPVVTLVLDRYLGIKDYTKVVVKATIKTGDEVTAEETRTYDIAASSLRIQKKVLASLESENPYTETDNTESFTGTPFLKAFTVDCFNEGLVNTETSFEGTLTTAGLSVLGLQASNVEGNVQVTMELDGEQITNVSYAYTSSNGNNISIITTFNY